MSNNEIPSDILKPSCYGCSHTQRVSKPPYPNSTRRAKHRLNQCEMMDINMGTPTSIPRSKPHRPQQYYRCSKACSHAITAVPKQQHFSSFWALKLRITVSSFSFPDTPEAHELLWAKTQEKQGYCPDIPTEHTGNGQWLEACKPESYYERERTKALDLP